MATNPKKYLVRQGGVTKQESSVKQSAGSADAGKIPSLGDDGRLDETFLPIGIGAQTSLLPASEELNAGNLVNIFTEGGVAKVRKADNSNNRPADGFVVDAVSSTATATVYPLENVNSGLTGLTPGATYWLGTAGAVIAVPLDESDVANDGKVSQQIGKALSATELRTDDYGFVIL